MSYLAIPIPNQYKVYVCVWVCHTHPDSVFWLFRELVETMAAPPTQDRNRLPACFPLFALHSMLQLLHGMKPWQTACVSGEHHIKVRSERE